MLRVKCYVSSATCQVLRVKCYVSRVLKGKHWFSFVQYATPTTERTGCRGSQQLSMHAHAGLLPPTPAPTPAPCPAVQCDKAVSNEVRAVPKSSWTGSTRTASTRGAVELKSRQLISADSSSFFFLYYLLLATCYLLLTTYYWLFTTYYLLLATYYLRVVT